MRKLFASGLSVCIMAASSCLTTDSALAEPIYPAEDPAPPTAQPSDGIPAEVVYAVGGARPPGIPWERYTTQAGARYVPEGERKIIDYPAGALFSWVPDVFRDSSTPRDAVTIGFATEVATENLKQAILSGATQGVKPAVAIGLSGGTLALDHAMVELAGDPNAPPPESVSFLTIGDPTARHGFGASLLSRLAEPGTYFPVVDLTVPEQVDSQYDRHMIVAAYDGFADFPDRPENILAVANAIVGGSVVHTSAAFTSPDMVPPQNIKTTVNPRGGTTTTYLVPSQFLPLTFPLRELGAPASWVDQIDAALQPLIDAAYYRNDDPTSRPASLHPAGMDPIAVLDAPERGLIDEALAVIRQFIPAG